MSAVCEFLRKIRYMQCVKRVPVTFYKGQHAKDVKYCSFKNQRITER